MSNKSISRRRGHQSNDNLKNIFVMTMTNKGILITLFLLVFGSICIYSNFALVQEYSRPTYNDSWSNQNGKDVAVATGSSSVNNNNNNNNNVVHEYRNVLGRGSRSSSSLRSGRTSSTNATSAKNENNQSQQEVILQWKSSKSVVIGLAAGYGLGVYKSFVGSLRSTGYDGNIILGIAPNPSSDVVSYLEKQNVTTYQVEKGNCTYKGYPQVNGRPSEDQVCSVNYPDYKIQWSRFLMAKDWLLACQECTDGVMLTDVRDAFYQSDPFAYFDLPQVQIPKPIMVFEEIFPNLTVNHWLTEMPVSKCRKTKILRNHSLPMICSGSTMGSREGILRYIDAMKKEFDYWKHHDNCRSDMVGDDQAIHDYLFYQDKFGYGSDSNQVVAVKHRTGPIHVVGFQADKIFRRAIKNLAESQYGEQRNMTIQNMKAERYRIPAGAGSDDNSVSSYPWQDWLGKSPLAGPPGGFVDPTTGYILNNNGVPSPQLHQFDRFGLYFHRVYLKQLGNEKKW